MEEDLVLPKEERFRLSRMRAQRDVRQAKTDMKKAAIEIAAFFM